MEVADADRVHVTERPDADLGGGPRTDPRHGRQAGVALGEGQVHDRLEPGRPRGDPADEVGPALLDPERVVGVVGQGRQGGRRGSEPEPPALAGPGAGSPWTRMSPVHARCASWPVTFCSRMAGTSDSRTAPVRGIRTPTSRRASWATSGCPAGIGRRVAVEREQGGDVRQGPFRAWSVASARIASPADGDADGDRAVGVPGRPPRPSRLEVDGRVAPPARQRRRASGAGRADRRADRSGWASRGC